MPTVSGCLQGCDHDLDWCHPGDGGAGHGEDVPAAAAVCQFGEPNRGANVGSCQATLGDNQPWLVQLDGPSGHAQPRAATLRVRLKSSPATRAGRGTALEYGDITDYAAASGLLR